MTNKQRYELWVKSGPYGKGMNAHFTIEAQTDHSTGPTFAQIDVMHSTPEALATADKRATLIAAAPELLEACRDASSQLRKIASLLNHIPKRYAAEISATIRYGDIDDVIAKAEAKP